MKLSEGAEEILEILWIFQEEKGNKYISIEQLPVKNRDLHLAELKKIGYISIKDNKVNLLDKGKEYACRIVRYHRLAERLMVDVLQVKEGLINKTACQFEHIIQPDLEESICTLLGHPKTCPHGKQILPGKCCLEAKWIIESSVRPLTTLKPGETGKVAYLHTTNDKKLQKLMVMGVLPGINITLLHKRPSYVFQVGYTQVAVDKEIANSIYVRIKK